MLRLLSLLIIGMFFAAQIWGDPSASQDPASDAPAGAAIAAETAPGSTVTKAEAEQIRRQELRDRLREIAENGSNPTVTETALSPEALKTAKEQQAERAAQQAVADMQPAPATTEAPQRLAVVTGSVVNFREGPSSARDVVGQVHQGDEIEMIGAPQSGWQEIRIEGDGGTGWIFDRYISALDQ